MDGLPPDPLPDLTIVTIPGTVIRNGLGQLVQLVPDRVVAAEILERDDAGAATRVRLL